MALSRSARIILLLVVDILFFFLELTVGYLVGSLALVADSFHMLTDVMSLLISLCAIQLTERAPNDIYSYGWQRAEILAALINGVFLLALCLSITLQAIQRFINLPDVSQPLLVVIVGACGLASNIFGMLLFHEHDHSHPHLDIETHPSLTPITSPRKHEPSSPSFDVVDHQHSLQCEIEADDEIVLDVENCQVKFPAAAPLSPGHSHGSMNMRSLMLHIMGDAFGNISVIVTGLVIWLTTWRFRFYLDPVASILISVIISCSAFPLVRRATHILLQAVPRNVSLDDIRKSMLEVHGVQSVDELHIWGLSEHQNVATIHVTVLKERDFQCVMDEVSSILHQNGLTSSSNTIQIKHHPTYDDIKTPVVDSCVLPAL